MVDDVGGELAGGGLGLDPGDELAAGRAYHFDLHEREALVEGGDDLPLHLGKIGGVIHQRAFPLRRLDQLRRPERIFPGPLRSGSVGHGRGRQPERAFHECASRRSRRENFRHRSPP